MVAIVSRLLLLTRGMRTSFVQDILYTQQRLSLKYIMPLKQVTYPHFSFLVTFPSFRREYCLLTIMTSPVIIVNTSLYYNIFNGYPFSLDCIVCPNRKYQQNNRSGDVMSPVRCNYRYFAFHRGGNAFLFMLLRFIFWC